MTSRSRKESNGNRDVVRSPLAFFLIEYYAYEQRTFSRERVYRRYRRASGRRDPRSRSPSLRDASQARVLYIPLIRPPLSHPGRT